MFYFCVSVTWGEMEWVKEAQEGVITGEMPKYIPISELSSILCTDANERFIRGIAKIYA